MHGFTHPLGDTVRAARTAKGLTQVSLAEQVNIDSRTVINIENYNGNPKMAVLFPLIRTLDIDPMDIFYPELKGQNAAVRQLQLLLKDCSEDEIASLLPIIQAALSVLRAKDGIEIK